MYLLYVRALLESQGPGSEGFPSEAMMRRIIEEQQQRMSQGGTYDHMNSILNNKVALIIENYFNHCNYVRTYAL